jgi:hypothetical protein
LARDVSPDEVWTALDWLADAGLLVARAAPPAAHMRVSRREIFWGVMSAPLAIITAAANQLGGTGQTKATKSAGSGNSSTPAPGKSGQTGEQGQKSPAAGKDQPSAEQNGKSGANSGEAQRKAQTPAGAGQKGGVPGQRKSGQAEEQAQKAQAAGKVQRSAEQQGKNAGNSTEASRKAQKSGAAVQKGQVQTGTNSAQKGTGKKKLGPASPPRKSVPKEPKRDQQVEKAMEAKAKLATGKGQN